MGSIHAYETKSGKRYLVRFIKPNGLQGSKKGFPTKYTAERFLASISTSISRSEFIDPRDARQRIAELGETWLKDQQAVLKPSSFHPLGSAWRVHVAPRWGLVPAGDVRYSEVRAWVSELSATHSATTVIRAYGILAAILDIAVRDRRIAENPARGIRLPKKQPKRRVYLTHDQVRALAETSRHPELVYFLAYTGVRWGEATGLLVHDVDLTRRRVFIQENAVLVGSTLHIGTPKTHVKRSVPFPDFLTSLVVASMRGKLPEAPLFGDGNGHMIRSNSRDGWFAAAVRRAMAGDPTFARVTPHDLRHTAASLAISAGANVKAVQRMLGHASAAMTLDTYADLFDDDLDAVALALSRARDQSLAFTRPLSTLQLPSPTSFGTHLQ